MVTFCVSIALLITGYFVYGRVVEKIFGVEESRETPVMRMADGVDYVAMPYWKLFMIQFLNIAGLGPIFGAIAGALWGPVAFLWIVFGCIFGGAVHDYFSGMMSIRHDGASIPEIVGIYMGRGFKNLMRIFSVFVLLLVGVVFMSGPAGLLASLTPESLDKNFWLIVILIYYIMATILPIDKIIGKIYPIFSICLLVMAFGIGGGLILQGYAIPEITLQNLHYKALPVWPLLFVSIACGAVSGFHATQSPMMARCMTNEKLGRKVFYGAMIAEGIVTLIWAAAAMSFFGSTGELGVQMDANNGAAYVATTASKTMLGPIGGFLAILGIIACPITTGDTAFRSMRLTIADLLHYDQRTIKNRVILTIPLFIAAFLMASMNFDILWRYMAWSNQTLAVITLWTASMYCIKKQKFHWICSIPATFMTAVCATYILFAPEGLELSASIAYPIGLASACVSLVIFLLVSKKYNEKIIDISQEVGI